MPTDGGGNSRRWCARLLAAGTSLWLAAGAQAADNGCLADGSGFLTARLRGDLNLDLEWRGTGLTCTGMPRPDGLGMRLRFSSSLPDGRRFALVFAPPRLAEGSDARAVPVNITVLDESSGRIFSTRGENRCLLDEVRQQQLPQADDRVRRWAVSARGFCTQPARALDDDAPLLLTRFDFRGLVSYRDADSAGGKERNE